VIGGSVPRIVPSQVVELIDQIFPGAKDQPDTKEKRFSISRNHAFSVAAIINLVEQIPQELFVLPSLSYAAFVSSVASLKTVLITWNLRDYGIERIPGFGNRNPVTLIRNALAECPDEFPSVSTARLTFIQDEDLRKNLEVDISAANQALLNGEWKAATVLSGSVIEALLLWALSQREAAEVDAGVKRVVAKGVLTKNPGSDPEKWGLQPFIEVAAEISIISSETAQQARLAQGFRNLIHAGRELRLKQRCNRGTALSGVAAVEHVVRDLTP
jgi:hypothetical protein